MSIENLEALNGIDESFIVSAENAEKSSRKRPVWKLVLPAAAALLLVVGAVFGAKAMMKRGTKPEDDLVTAELPVPAETEQAADNAGEIRISAAELYDMGLFSGGGNEAGLIEGSDEAFILNRPLLVFGGKIYYQCDVVTPLLDLVGERIGEIERLDLSDYLVSYDDESFDRVYKELKAADCESKGYIGGPLYTVKGYDPERLVCMRGGEGETELFLCEDGIAENGGKALFEEVFGLTEKVAGLDYYNHENETIMLPRLENEPVFLALAGSLNEGDWFSIAYDDGENPFTLVHDCGIGNVYSLCVKLNNGLGVDIVLYSGGTAIIGNYMYGYGLRIDSEKLKPLYDAIEAQSGENKGALSYSPYYTFEDCQNNERFGAMVPKACPDTYFVRRSAIIPILDDENVIIGTEMITIGMKSYKKDANIDFDIMSAEMLEEKLESFYTNFYKYGGTLRSLEDITIDDIVSHGDNEHGYARWIAAVYGDMGIVIEGIDASAEDMFEVISSILN